MDFTKVKNNLEKLGYIVKTFSTATDATNYLVETIQNKSVGFGGSVTVDQMQLYEKLSPKNKVYWHHRPQENLTRQEIISNANTAQIYICSVNGLAETGEILNIDGNCNRISSAVYGHEKVCFVVGKNKIAYDFDAALYRARNIASPQNARRVGAKTPCAAKADKCYNCKSPNRICRVLTVMWASPMTGEFEIILIDENLGF